MTYLCRHCKSKLSKQVIDLGHQPPSNAYLDKSQLSLPETKYPMKVFVCESCWLFQLPEHVAPEKLFTPNYAYLSSTSESWINHSKNFAYKSIQDLKLNQNSLVVEIASNDGYLLQYFKSSNIPCLGIEPTKLTAEIAISKGIKTLKRFFNYEFSKELQSDEPLCEQGADLIIANNVAAHVPDINDFIRGIANLLKPLGRASIEFPHLYSLLKFNQFDTIYHEHFSYFSLYTFSLIAYQNGLIVEDVETLNTHGGSLRVWLTHLSQSEPNQRVLDLLNKEEDFGLQSLSVYNDFQNRAIKAKHDLLDFLLSSLKKKQKVIAYGAAAKGNTLLNFAGIKDDLLPYVVDKAKSKQGKFLPGSHIPIVSPELIAQISPDTLLVLPWNILQELRVQLKGYDLVTAIPEIKYWNS